MKKLFLTGALAVILPSFTAAGGSTAPAAAVKPAQPAQLAQAGKKNSLPGGGWFTWKFDNKPKLGTCIMIIQAYSKDGRRDTSYELIGDSGMPSMPYHDSGAVKFKKNKKGNYLLPVDVVMPGEWRVIVRVKKDKKEIYAGEVLFNI